MATQTIQIIVTDRGGARTVKRDLTAVGTAADRVNKKTGKLVGTLRNVATVSRDIRNLFLILGAAKTFGFVRGASDEFKRINNTLRGFEVGAKNLDNVRKQLKAVANESRVGAKETTVLFGRLKKATQSLGLSDREVLKLTGTAQKALRLGGASATEAAQAVRQLTQAFNKGKLDGDEFRSVLENAPVLAELLSDKLGVTKDVLRKLAEEGEITTEVLVGALQNGTVKIDQLFGTLATTSDDAFAVLRNNMVEMVGELDRVTGASRAAISVIQQFSGDVGGNLSNAFLLAGASSLVLFRRWKNVNNLLKLTPIGAAILVFVKLNDEIKELSGGTRNLGSVFGDVAYGINIAVQFLRDFVSELYAAANLKPADGSLFKQMVDWSLGSIALFDKDTQKRLRTEGFERFAQGAEIQGIARDPKGIFPKGVPTGAELQERMAKKQAPFYEMKTPKQTALQKLKGINKFDPVLTENMFMFHALSEQIKNAKEDYRDELKNSVTGGSFLVAGQRERFDTAAKQVDRVKAATDLESKLMSVEEIINKAAEGQDKLAIQAAELQGKIVKSVQAALASPEGENGAGPATAELLRGHAKEVEGLLKSLEDASGAKAIGDTIQNSFKADIKKLEDLKSKIQESKTLKDEEKQASIETVDQAAAAANQIMIAATTKTASIMRQLYLRVIQDLRGLAGTLPGAGGLAAPTGIGTAVFQLGTPGESSQGPADPGASINKLNESLREINTEIRTATDGIQELGDRSVSSFATASESARGFGNTTNNIGNQIQNNFGQVFSSLENALVSFVTTGKLDFKSLIQSMIADLARLLIRMLIIRPLMGFFGGIFGFSGGGLVGGGGFSSGGSVPSFSSGGSSFGGGGCPGGVCNIPGFATGSGMITGFGGTRSDNFLAAVSPGEFVMNAQDTRRNLPDLMRMNHGQSVQKSGGGGGAVVNNTSITVNVESSGNNPGEDGAKIARAIEVQMDKRLNEYTRQQMRPGSAFKQREA